MAYPTTEAARFRERVTQLTNQMRTIDAILATVEDHGADDTARQTFFDDVFGVDSDITWNEFASGVVALRNMRTAWNTNKLAIAKLLT